MRFKSVVFDSVPFSPGKPYTLFVDTHSNDSESVTKQTESQIANWLFNLDIARSLIFSELGVSEQGTLFRLEVKHPVVLDCHKKPGDIDVLIWKEQCPHQAIAIECERVKVTAENMQEDHRNRIPHIKDGVTQANELNKMGFYQSYLAVLIITDGRNRDEYNMASRGANPQTIREVYDFPNKDKLSPDIGILFIEIVQPIGKNISQAGQIGVYVARKAKTMQQSLSLTNRIIKWVNLQRGSLSHSE